MRLAPSLSERISRINALDLEPMKYKLVIGEDGPKWNIEKADAVALEYKRFLILNLRNSISKELSSIVPTKNVDTFWHYHILDTQKYQLDSEYCLGYFLHHFPYLGLRGEEDVKLLAESYRASVGVYRREYGCDPLGVEASGDCDAAQCSPASCNGDDSPLMRQRPVLVR